MKVYILIFKDIQERVIDQQKDTQIDIYIILYKKHLPTKNKSNLLKKKKDGRRTK